LKHEAVVREKMGKTIPNEIAIALNRTDKKIFTKMDSVIIPAEAVILNFTFRFQIMFT
jgi:hypothetical protein